MIGNDVQYAEKENQRNSQKKNKDEMTYNSQLNMYTTHKDKTLSFWNKSLKSGVPGEYQFLLS